MSTHFRYFCYMYSDLYFQTTVNRMSNCGNKMPAEAEATTAKAEATTATTAEAEAVAEVAPSPSQTDCKFAATDVRIKQKAIAEARNRSLADFVIPARPRQGQMKKMKKFAGV